VCYYAQAYDDKVHLWKEKTNIILPNLYVKGYNLKLHVYFYINKKIVDEFISLFILRFYSILIRLLKYEVVHTNACERIVFANGSLLATLKWLCKVVITAMR